MSADQIIRAFTYHAPTSNQVELYRGIREGAADLALALDVMLVDSREKSLALTKLEEVVMWANASVARAPRV